jgi:hypothetical protein
MENRFPFFLKVTIQWYLTNQVIEDKVNSSLKEICSTFHLKLHHFYLLHNYYLWFYIKVHKCLVKYSTKKLEWVLHWVLTSLSIKQSIKKNSYEYSYEYIHTHEIIWVLVWVIWVLMLASRTLLMSTFTRV